MNEKNSNTGARRRWSAREKAKIVRHHLREGVGLANLPDETGTVPEGRSAAGANRPWKDWKGSSRIPGRDRNARWSKW